MNWIRRLRAPSVRKIIQDNSITGQDHDDDSLLTVWEGWAGIYQLYTLLLLRAGLYHLYNKAIWKEWERPYHRYPPVEYKGRFFKCVTDLRLGSNGYFPLDDDPYYNVPDQVQGMADAIERELGTFVFSDEYSTCDVCGKIIRTSPDSYSWQPRYINTGWGLVHNDCVDEDMALNYMHDHVGQGIPDFILNKLPDYVVVDVEYNSGLHHGMDDSPEKIVSVLKQNGIQCWFKYEPSQFYTSFKPVVYFEVHDLAMDILSGFNAYQGWSNADEMSKALSTGKSTEHIKVTKRTITPQEFIDGIKEDE